MLRFVTGSRPIVRQKRFFCTPKTKWQAQPDLPYINNSPYLQTLAYHVSKQPQSKVLLIWGPRSVSKTGGLQLKIDEWKSEKHPVLDVELKGMPIQFSEFQIRFSKAFRDANLKIPNDQIVAIAENQLRRNKDNAEGNLKSAFFSVGTLVSFVRIMLTGKAALPLVLAWRTAQYASILLQWVQGKTSPDAPMDFVAVLELLELYAQSSEKPPIVVIREIQNISELRSTIGGEIGQDIYERLFVHFEPRKQRTSRVPVIFESSDLLWTRQMHQHGTSVESFDTYLLKPFDEATAKDWLVERTLKGFQEPVFTEEEFSSVWEWTQGHQGSIYKLHAKLKSSGNLQDTIKELRDSYNSRFSSIVAAGANLDQLKDRHNFLQRLRDSKYSLVVESLELNTPARHFVESNVLFTNGSFVSPQSAPWQHAIEYYLVTVVKYDGKPEKSQ